MYGDQYQPPRIVLPSTNLDTCDFPSQPEPFFFSVLGGKTKMTEKTFYATEILFFKKNIISENRIALQS